jgi:hypothetical protein
MLHCFRYQYRRLPIGYINHIQNSTKFHYVTRHEVSSLQKIQTILIRNDMIASMLFKFYFKIDFADIFRYSPMFFFFILVYDEMRKYIIRWKEKLLINVFKISST